MTKWVLHRAIKEICLRHLIKKKTTKNLECKFDDGRTENFPISCANSRTMWHVTVLTLNWRPNDLKRVIYLAHSNCDKRSRDIHGPNDCNVEDTHVCLHNSRKWADAIDKKTYIRLTGVTDGLLAISIASVFNNATTRNRTRKWRLASTPFENMSFNKYFFLQNVQKTNYSEWFHKIRKKANRAIEIGQLKIYYLISILL